jgi:hypothetical protein
MTIVDLPALRSLLAAATGTLDGLCTPSFPLPFRVEHVRHMQHDVYDADGENLGSFAFELPSELTVAAVNVLPMLLSVYEAALAWREVVRDERYDPLDAGTDLIAAIDLARSGK